MASATKAKATNYTEAQAQAIKTEFGALTSASGQKELVEKFAMAFGKNTRSIVAKASNLGVYQKPEKVTKAGEPVESKAEIVTSIEFLCGDGAGDLSSLESATKQALFAIRRALTVGAEQD